MVRFMTCAAVCGAAAIVMGGCSEKTPRESANPSSAVVAPKREYLETPVQAAAPPSTPPESAPAAETAPSDAGRMEPPPQPAEHAPSAGRAADDQTARFVGLAGPKPATWLEQPPPMPMYKATYRVPGVDGAEAAQIAVFHFGDSDRGSVQANMDRWVSQVQGPDGGPVEPKVEHFEADGMPITLVELAGAYKGMGMDAFRPNYLFLSAIVEAPAGKVYVRFVGPAQTVQANREAYLAMLKELHRIAVEK